MKPRQPYTQNVAYSPKSQDIKLPYLGSSQKHRQNRGLSLKKYSPSMQRAQREFDLRTSNVKIPPYNPENDKNLKFFFEKTANKKLFNRLKEDKRSASNNHIQLNKKIAQPQRSQTQVNTGHAKQNQNQLVYQNNNRKIRIQDYTRKRMGTVSSQQFMNYLENVRSKILSSYQNEPKRSIEH